MLNVFVSDFNKGVIEVNGTNTNIVFREFTNHTFTYSYFTTYFILLLIIYE